MNYQNFVELIKENYGVAINNKGAMICYEIIKSSKNIIYFKYFGGCFPFGAKEPRMIKFKVLKKDNENIKISKNLYCIKATTNKNNKKNIKLFIVK